MTFRTSAVAVCCWSDSLKSSVRSHNSRSSRVFSMAITACCGAVVEQLNLLVSEWADLLPIDPDCAD